MSSGVQPRAARIAGAMFLLVNAVGVFSELIVRGSLLKGDPAQVAQNLRDSEFLYRLAVAGDLVIFVAGLVLVWALYVLLRPVNRDLALLSGALRGTEAVVGAAAAIGNLVAIRMLTGAEYRQAFEPDELHALSRLARSAFSTGQDVGFIFLGLGTAGFAYLLWRSRVIPRILAGWGIFASLLFAAYNLLTVVFPGVTNLMVVALAPMGIFEIGAGLWLVTRSVNVQNDGVGP